MATVAIKAIVAADVISVFMIFNVLSEFKFNSITSKTNHVPKNYHGSVNVVSVRKDSSLNVSIKASSALFW